jgi:hypothetical protein
MLSFQLEKPDKYEQKRESPCERGGLQEISLGIKLSMFLKESPDSGAYKLN